ncbi:1,4-dihydroxy-2-naphthoyl-CoA hydrolase [Streptomyces sp. SAI-126]|uniref:PaaI family thioesterase n=2 Tax=unclassified Streptomyces TaxID=2593676 RepID=UPI000FADD18A|nr:1,4-dihydroxy-2-naphthoyl-CoA hydrolase [Streptomyces sp. SAI-119]MDH6494916.1 1,4-dihydroxy-2-naphthoyl-CoA hydrolase [Streptomyces sp. SAI-149]
MESRAVKADVPAPAEPPVPRSMLSVPPALADRQLATRMGIEIVSWDPDRLVGTMPVDGNQQPFGWLHGGANAVLVETLGSVAAGLHVAPRGTVAGLELSCTHHRAARSGLVTGVCTPLQRGDRVASYQVSITDDQGRLTCTARLTCLVYKR